MSSHKFLFLSLCLTVWFINSFTNGGSGHHIWLGLYASIVSIPIWAFIGSVFSSITLFVLRLARVDMTRGLSLWQKADVGLALAVVLKPALGIPL